MARVGEDASKHCRCQVTLGLGDDDLRAYRLVLQPNRRTKADAINRKAAGGGVLCVLKDAEEQSLFWSIADSEMTGGGERVERER